MQSAEADPTPNVSERQPGNLPVELSSFIGREREIAEIEGLLAEHRLLTLTGPGGAARRSWP